MLVPTLLLYRVSGLGFKVSGFKVRGVEFILNPKPLRLRVVAGDVQEIVLTFCSSE